MDAYEVFSVIMQKYVAAHSKVVGHDPFVLELNFATYISVFLWYSLFLATVYTAFTADRADAILCVFTRSVRAVCLAILR